KRCAKSASGRGSENDPFQFIHDQLVTILSVKEVQRATATKSRQFVREPFMAVITISEYILRAFSGTKNAEDFFGVLGRKRLSTPVLRASSAHGNAGGLNQRGFGNAQNGSRFVQHQRRKTGPNELDPFQRRFIRQSDDSVFPNAFRNVLAKHVGS